MQMMVEKELMDFEDAKKSIGLKLEPDNSEEYSPRFEIRERTMGLANPKIIPLSKKNLTEIMIGIFSMKELKEIEKMKRERKGN